MLSILDRYIGRSILLTKAAQYILLTLPGKAYLLFAPAVLLGSLLGLGTIASNSELIVMRAAGVSNMRIIRAVLMIVPRAEQVAEQLRLTALEKRVSVRGSQGLWIKSDQRFVNISTVMPDLTLLGLSVWEYDSNQLIRTVEIEKAVQQSDSWLMSGLKTIEFTEEGTRIQHADTEVWPVLVNVQLLRSLSISLESLSLTNLIDQMSYLKKNNLDSERVELAYWTKLTSPLATIVMLMLSLPFVFASQRSGGAGQKIFIGILLGIAYVLANKLLTHLGLTYGLSPALSAFLPLLLFLSFSIFGIQRIP